MDYEQAYKAVLETATQWIKDGCTDKERICLESVFPELRESEDERIRREIIDFICQKIDRGSVTKEQREKSNSWLAWLEKQKESLHIEKTCKENADSFTDEERIRKWLVDYFKAVERTCIHWDISPERIVSYLEKQKEIPLMNGDADLYFDEWNQQKPNPTKRQCFEEGMKYAQRLQKGQKLTERIEFDKSVLEDAICATDLLGNDESFNKDNPNLANAFRIAKDWLKSLPERFSYQTK